MKLKTVLFLLCTSTSLQAMMKEIAPLQKDIQEEQDVGCSRGLWNALRDGCKEPLEEERDIKRYDGCLQNTVNRSCCFCSSCFWVWVVCLGLCCCAN